MTIILLNCVRNQENNSGEHAAPNEVWIMQNTMNNRWDIPCYSFIAINPGKVSAFFARLIGFFKAALTVRNANEHGLSDAMEARLYL